jgi:type VI secretion system protein ImpG
VIREQDKRYQAYLEQLQTLAEFRQIHNERHPEASIDEEDPAVSRIVEALAYFSVGTQLTAQNTMSASLERLLSGYFDFLLSPMPAMATLQLGNVERLLDLHTLPEGAQLTLTTLDGASGSFRTLHDLPLLHAQLDHTEVVVREDGFRLLVPLRAQIPVSGLPMTLPLQIHYLDRYGASLRLTHNLRRHLRGVSAYYDTKPQDGRPGLPCELAFGAVLGNATVCSNPLERLRLLLHYPELELSMQVALPRAPRPWTSLTLAFDLDSKWPDSRAAASDPFVLHSVPMINLKRAPAAAIRHDGLQLVHPILPNERDRDFKLASIAGVYEIDDAGSGLQPLPPNGLPGTAEGYEVERTQTATGLRHRLILRLPGALTKPRRVMVEADWCQPDFSPHAVGPIRVGLADRHLDGVQLKLLGAVRQHVDSPLAKLSSVLLELLAMRMKPTLRRDELIAVLGLLGLDDQSPFHPILQRIRDLTVDTMPDLGAVSARYRYRLRVDALAPSEEALAWTLFARIRELLDAWSTGGAVSVAGARANIHRVAI